MNIKINVLSPSFVNTILIVLLVLVNLLVFLPSVKGDFVWDDVDLIVENHFLQSTSFQKDFLFSPFEVLESKSEKKNLFEGSTKFYRPFSILSFWIDKKIWGLNPAGFHITNIFIHILNSILMLFVTFNLGFRKMPAFFSSVLFSLYPLHFKNVSWISGRTDLLSFLFVLISLLFFIEFIKKKQYLFLMFSSLFYLFSLFSKENCIFLIVAFFLIIFSKYKSFKKGVIFIVPHLFILFCWFLLRSFALGTVSWQSSGRGIFDFFAVLGFYLCKILFPFKLSFSVNSIDVFGNIYYQIIGIIISLIIVVIVYFIFRRKSFVSIPGIAVVCFYLFLIPSTVIIFFASTNSLIAWRFLYAASAIFLGLLIHFLSRVIKYRTIFASLLIVLSIFYSIEIYPKNLLFGKKKADFWISIDNLERESLIVQFNAGSYLLFINEKKAIETFNRILRKRKDHRKYQYYRLGILENLASYYSIKENYKEAKKYFDAVLKINKNPGIELSFNYALFLSKTGEEQKGTNIINDLLRKNPQNHRALTFAIKFYLSQNNYKRAIQILEKDYFLFRTKESRELIKKLKQKKSFE